MIIKMIQIINIGDAFRMIYNLSMSFAGSEKYYGYTVKSRGNKTLNIKEK